MPGIGDQWFGGDYAPDGWTSGERGSSSLTEAIPLASFILIGSLFYLAGGKTRGDTGEVAVKAAEEEGLAAK